MKVRIKKEIVTLGVDGIDPTRNVGTYVAPEKWNELISRDDVVLIDTRNDYEYTVGSFAGAVNPMTRSFREFPEYVAANLNPEKTPKVAMFCTVITSYSIHYTKLYERSGISSLMSVGFFSFTRSMSFFV